MSGLTQAQKRALYDEAFTLLDRAQALLEGIEERCHQRAKELGYAPVPKYSEWAKEQGLR